MREGVKIAFQEWKVNEGSSPQATETENDSVLPNTGYFFRLLWTDPFAFT